MNFDETTGLYTPDSYEHEALGYGELDQLIPFNKNTLLHAIAASRSNILSIEVCDLDVAGVDHVESIAARHGWLGRLEDMERQLNGEELDTGVAKAAQYYINSFNDLQ